MIAQSLAMLLANLGVTKSHSRPHVSDDNPYSEAQFKTMKYRPDYPQRFGCQLEARTWSRASSLGTTVLQAAYQNNPERFVQGPPQPPQLPTEVWINPPRKAAQDIPYTIVVGEEAVDPVVNSELSGELSTSPQQVYQEIVQISLVETGIRV